MLARAAAEAECDLHLALISIEESGIAEYNGDYRRGGWRHRDEDEDDGFEAGEVTDQALTLSAWRRTDGGEAELGPLPFSEEE